MSLASWQKEFYKKPADQCRVVEALEHSIRKWRGLTKASLKRHRLFRVGHVIHGFLEEGGKFLNGTQSCALCQIYYDGGCYSCPLCKVRGDTPCYYGEEPSRSPYDVWVNTGNSWPMLKWLRRARKLK